MKKITYTASIILFTASLLGEIAVAQTDSNGRVLEQIETYNEENSFSQVTSVDQLRDVSPGDWAYEALRSLVERYGCIAGYPNGTFRGNRSLSRYEFAAGLNACLNHIERLIASSQAVLQEDLTKLQKLVDEFSAEITALGARFDNLEGRTKFLEDHQFSTTTKLEGQVIFGLGTIFAGDDVNGNEVNKTTIFGDRIRLELNTSFNGEDLLFTRLSAGNFQGFSGNTGTLQGDLAFVQDDGNNLGLEVLLYRFPLNKNTEVVIAAAGMAADDIANTVNPLDGDAAEGAISLFGTRNPIYFQPDGAGLGIIQKIGEKIEVSAGYFAANAEDSTEGNGLFNGAYSALGQILFKPSDSLNLALTYVHSYNQSDTGTGSSLANLRALTEENFLEAVSTSSNSYGVQVSWKLSDKFVVGGWGGFSTVRTLSDLGGQISKGEQDIWNWAVTLAFPDLGKEGNLAGIIVGMEPWVTDSDIVNLPTEDANTSLHLEAFYQYKVTDNIAITPGVIWITNPGNNENNNDEVIGTLRTTFSF